MPPEEIKKSYNPFKMWGSWIGLFAQFLALYFFVNEEKIFSWRLLQRHSSECGDICSFLMTIPGFVLGYGFLIGWVIHSLFRKFSK